MVKKGGTTRKGTLPSFREMTFQEKSIDIGILGNPLIPDPVELPAVH
jgi:hypothetical protein